MSSCKTKSNRKGPRRPPPKEPLDDDMSELAAVLAEHQLDNNAAGWFKLPWRDGWNAIELALRVSFHEHGFGDQPWLAEVCKNRSTTQDIYWIAQDLLAPTVTPNRMLRAAFRCLQVLLAKSDGGGEVYNAILVGAFFSVDVSTAENLVLEFRCRDSIGVGAKLLGDGNDRLRRAFTIAWKRGLYAAAYSLPAAREKL